MSELRGEFKLHYFSVAKELVMEGSVLSQSASEILLAEVQKHDPIDVNEGHVLIPAHPLQAHYLLLQNNIKDLLESY